MGETFRTERGLATLGGPLVEIRTLLENQFLRWASDAGAEAMLFPPLVPVAELDRFDYFRNFPHLAAMATRIDSGRVADYAKLSPVSNVPRADLADAGYALPSAACYSVYLHLKNERLADTRYVTTVATCFRNENTYTDLQRLWSFSMREIVCIGTREAALAHLGAFKTKIGDFMSRLDLPVQVETASDPFFQPESASGIPENLRALTQKLFPTKEEFLYRGSVAIASVNFHRNFFGERCEIRTADEQFAFTGCVAFGIERWIHALLEQYRNDTRAISTALRDAVGA